MNIQVLVLLVLALLLQACGGGGGATTEKATGTTILGTAQLGYIMGGKVQLYRLSDIDNPIAETTTSLSTDSAQAGNFSLPSVNINEQMHYLLKVSGGQDIDANDDGVIDKVYTPLEGAFYAVVKGEQLLSGHVRVNALTDMLHQKLKGVENFSADYLDNMLKTNAKELIRDVNDDGVSNYLDILSFDPVFHSPKFKKSYRNVLRFYIPSIHRGVANEARMAMLATIDEPRIIVEGGNFQEVPFDLEAKVVNVPHSLNIKWFLDGIQQEKIDTRISEIGEYAISAKLYSGTTLIKTIDYSLVATRSVEVASFDVDSTQVSHLTVTEDESSRLAGAQVIVPAGALDEDMTLTMKQSDIDFLPVRGDGITSVLTMEPAGLKFNTPIQIRIPYFSSEDLQSAKVKVARYSEGGKIDYIDPLYVDQVRKEVVFETEHFTDFFATVFGGGSELSIYDQLNEEYPELKRSEAEWKKLLNVYIGELDGTPFDEGGYKVEDLAVHYLHNKKIHKIFEELSGNWASTLIKEIYPNYFEESRSFKIYSGVVEGLNTLSLVQGAGTTAAINGVALGAADAVMTKLGNMVGLPLPKSFSVSNYLSDVAKHQLPDPTERGLKLLRKGTDSIIEQVVRAPLLAHAYGEGFLDGNNVKPCYFETDSNFSAELFDNKTVSPMLPHVQTLCLRLISMNGDGAANQSSNLKSTLLAAEEYITNEENFEKDNKYPEIRLELEPQDLSEKSGPLKGSQFYYTPENGQLSIDYKIRVKGFSGGFSNEMPSLSVFLEKFNGKEYERANSESRTACSFPVDSVRERTRECSRSFFVNENEEKDRLYRLIVCEKRVFGGNKCFGSDVEEFEARFHLQNTTPKKNAEFKSIEVIFDSSRQTNEDYYVGELVVSFDSEIGPFPFYLDAEIQREDRSGATKVNRDNSRELLIPKKAKGVKKLVVNIRPFDEAKVLTTIQDSEHEINISEQLAKLIEKKDDAAPKVLSSPQLKIVGINGTAIDGVPGEVDIGSQVDVVLLNLNDLNIVYVRDDRRVLDCKRTSASDKEARYSCKANKSGLAQLSAGIQAKNDREIRKIYAGNIQVRPAQVVKLDISIAEHSQVYKVGDKVSLRASVNDPSRLRSVKWTTVRRGLKIDKATSLSRANFIIPPIADKKSYKIFLRVEDVDGNVQLHAVNVSAEGTADHVAKVEFKGENFKDTCTSYLQSGCSFQLKSNLKKIVKIWRFTNSSNVTLSNLRAVLRGIPKGGARIEKLSLNKTSVVPGEDFLVLASIRFPENLAAENFSALFHLKENNNPVVYGSGKDALFWLQLKRSAKVPSPPTPSGFSLSTLSRSVTLSWDKVEGAAHYNLYSAKESFGATANVDNYAALDGGSLIQVNGEDDEHTFSSLEAGKTYYFVITAVNESGESSAAKEIKATIKKSEANSINIATFMKQGGAHYVSLGSDYNEDSGDTSLEVKVSIAKLIAGLSDTIGRYEYEVKGNSLVEVPQGKELYITDRGIEETSDFPCSFSSRDGFEVTECNAASFTLNLSPVDISGSSAYSFFDRELKQERLDLTSDLERNLKSIIFPAGSFAYTQKIKYVTDRFRVSCDLKNGDCDVVKKAVSENNGGYANFSELIADISVAEYLSSNVADNILSSKFLPFTIQSYGRVDDSGVSAYLSFFKDGGLVILLPNENAIGSENSVARYFRFNWNIRSARAGVNIMELDFPDSLFQDVREEGGERLFLVKYEDRLVWGEMVKSGQTLSSSRITDINKIAYDALIKRILDLKIDGTILKK